MIEKLRAIWKVKDVRNRLLFVLGMLALFRVASHIPVPGVNLENLQTLFDSNQILSLLNMFSGGGYSNFSIVMLGVGPYITASIIMQLLTMIVPSLEAIQKEGEQGQQRINQYTRLLTIPMAILSSYGMIIYMKQSGAGIIADMPLFELITAIVTITGGTIFLMWLGELITEKKVGNGISLIIFAGIVAQIPSSIQQSISIIDSTQVATFIGFAVLALITIAGVVFVTEGQRNIPVNYAKRIRGNRMYGGVSTHLPLRVNQAGVIPIIFAVSIVLFPPLIAQFFVNSSTAWIATFATSVTGFFQNQTSYAIMYFVLVVAFTYFYTAVIFHPQQISENLQKQGGFIPGIRPGNPTAQYLGYISNRIILGGALFLGVIAVLPVVTQAATGISSFTIGGTSLLIVVSVVIETVKQIDAQLVMHDYEGL